MAEVLERMQEQLLELNPALPNPFLVLERKESFEEYANTYGDRITEHYENNGVVVIPFMPIRFDIDFFQAITFPPECKKIGTANGIDRSAIRREGMEIKIDPQHILVQMFGNPILAIYAQQQIASFNDQLRNGLRLLFPHYHPLMETNITWRLTETRHEPIHLDTFLGGAPTHPEAKNEHRLKFFINIDSMARQWRVSHDTPGVLKACRSMLPDALPDDINVLNNILYQEGVLNELPYHSVAFPTMSAVFANGESVVHQVIFGRRMVAGEYFCQSRQMLSPEKLTHTCLKKWLQDAGYAIADTQSMAAQYAQKKGGY